MSETTPKQDPPTIKDVVEAFKNFKPKIPISFIVAIRKALREKWGKL